MTNLILIALLIFAMRVLLSHGLYMKPNISTKCVSDVNSGVRVQCILNTSSNGYGYISDNITMYWLKDGQLVNHSTLTYRDEVRVVTEIVAKGFGRFVCAVEQSQHILQKENISITIQRSPASIRKLVATPRFTCDIETFPFVSFSWLRHNPKEFHEVFYNFDGTSNTLIANCNGNLCSSRIDTFGTHGLPISFVIKARIGLCEVHSTKWKFDLKLTDCHGTPSNSTLLYTPHPPTSIRIEKPSHQVILIEWEDVISWVPTAVRISFTCSETSGTFDNVTSIRKLYLSEKELHNYRPYDECTFCLSVQEYECGGFSIPLCGTTRLWAEVPSLPPTFTCTNKTCLISNGNNVRNVTVTWALPTNDSWNGVLTEVKVRYSTIQLNSSWTSISVPNVSKNSVLIVGLNSTLNYIINARVCNHVGCSIFSKELRIFSIKTNKHDKEVSDFIFVWISIAGVVFLAVVVVAFCVLKRRMNKKSGPPPLECLIEPLVDYENYFSSEKKSDEKLDTLTNEPCRTDESG